MPPRRQAGPLRNAKIVESFRGEAKVAVPLHPFERALVVLACVHLCFLPWMLGARAPWAQVVSAVLGAAALVLACWPRHYRGDLAPQGAFVLHPWFRLLKFPVFWIGLVLLGYVVCQALNPAYVRTVVGPYWFLAKRDHVTWLPSGVRAPFELMNAWRMLCIWGGAWALGCALWIGLTRRSAVHAVLTTVVANGAVLALIGILQKVTNAKEVLWSIKPVAHYFVSTFFYKNHAGAYFNLVLAVAVALAAWHHIRSLRRLERSSPAPVYCFAAVILAALVFLSGSRTAMILLIAYLVISAGVYLFWRVRNQAGTTHPAVAGLVGAGALVVVVGAAWLLKLDRGIEQIKFITTEVGQKMHVEPRLLAREATMDLVEMQPLTGWGAGSFRHIFPLTQKNYESIYRADSIRVFAWDHAHNDYAQALAEVGWIGFGLIAALALALLVKAVASGVHRQPGYLLGLGGLAMPLGHAWVDFPLYNCAIITTLCAVAVLLVRGLELESNR